MRLVKSIIIATLVHLFIVLNWSGQKQVNVAEIPGWVNIKLVAGFEDTAIPAKPAVKKTQQKIHKRDQLVNNSEPVIQEKVIEQALNETTAGATTYIEADSQPYQDENPRPVYPAAARRRGMEGSVLLSVKISLAGVVEHIDVIKSSGYKILDRAAVNSVLKWRFNPARNGDKTVDSILEIPIRFRLKSS